MAPHNDDVILTHLENIASDVAEIKTEVKAQNGRVRILEIDTAVLKDRADEAKISGRTWGATTGTLGGLLGGFLASLLGPGK